MTITQIQAKLAAMKQTYCSIGDNDADEWECDLRITDNDGWQVYYTHRPSCYYEHDDDAWGTTEQELIDWLETE